MAQTENLVKLENEEKNESSSESNDNTEVSEKQQEDQNEIQKEESIASLNFLEKNTSSFRCLAQIAMSSSSLMNQKMRFFPRIQDPGLDNAFNYLRKFFF